MSRKRGILKGLIADTDQVMLDDELGQLCQLLPGEHPAGGVVGGGEQHHLRLGRQPLLILLHPQAVVVLLIGGHLHHHAVEQLGVQEIAWIAGVVDQHLVSRLNKGGHGKIQAHVRAGIDDDVPLGVYFDVVVPLDFFRNDLFQVRIADGRGIVAGHPLLDDLHTALQYLLWDHPVWIERVRPAHQGAALRLELGHRISHVCLSRFFRKQAAVQGTEQGPHLVSYAHKLKSLPNGP